MRRSCPSTVLPLSMRTGRCWGGLRRAESPTGARTQGVVEHSVYVRSAARGRGIASILLKALIDSTEQAGIWTIQSGIFPENAASLAVHKRAGFRVIGTRKRVGAPSRCLARRRPSRAPQPRHHLTLSSAVRSRVRHHGRPSDADERGGGGAGPVAVAEQVQPRFATARVPSVAMWPRGPRRPSGARWDSAGRKPVHQMIASAPARLPSAQTTPLAVRRENIGCAVSESRVAGLAHGRDGDDVAERGDAAGVGAACVEGAAAGGGGIEQGAAVDVVGQEARRALGHPRQRRAASGRGRRRSARRSCRRRPRSPAGRRSRPGSGSPPCAAGAREDAAARDSGEEGPPPGAGRADDRAGLPGARVGLDPQQLAVAVHRRHAHRAVLDGQVVALLVVASGSPTTCPASGYVRPAWAASAGRAARSTRPGRTGAASPTCAARRRPAPPGRRG